MKEELLKQPVIQADETTLKVNRDGRKAGASSYMWVYITGEHDDSGKRSFCIITAGRGVQNT